MEAKCGGEYKNYGRELPRRQGLRRGEAFTLGEFHQTPAQVGLLINDNDQHSCLIRFHMFCPISPLEPQ
jgi:hypothetical protein